jgi:hypothetical protein
MGHGVVADDLDHASLRISVPFSARLKDLNSAFAATRAKMPPQPSF